MPKPKDSVDPKQVGSLDNEPTSKDIDLGIVVNPQILDAMVTNPVTQLGEFIITQKGTGTGEDKDPNRVVVQLWTKDGSLVLQYDAYKFKKAHGLPS